MAREAAISLTALFGRIFWMMIGPIFLMVLALGIAQQRDGWFAPTDFLYFLVLGGMLFGRHTEFRYGDPLTSPLFLYH